MKKDKRIRGDRDFAAKQPSIRREAAVNTAIAKRLVSTYNVIGLRCCLDTVYEFVEEREGTND